MSEWVTNIFSALFGAILALCIREFIEWLKRPQLKIDFEKRNNQKPYIPDYNDERRYVASEFTHKIKYLRLIVQNKGRKPAMDCEAKLELFPDGARHAANKVALHWSRHDPELYSKYEGGILVSSDREKIFAPISLNIDDEETVDVFRLDYHFSTKHETDHSLKSKPYIESASLKNLVLQANNKYHCKVTVYSSNTTPKSFEFSVDWDGKVEGFDRAFTKD